MRESPERDAVRAGVWLCVSAPRPDLGAYHTRGAQLRRGTICDLANFGRERVMRLNQARQYLL